MRCLGEEIRSGQRATDKVDELVAELLGVNRTDSRCLDILEQHGLLTAGQLATSSGLSTGAVTAVVDRLERAGYARRIPDPSDRRRVLVDLTDRARELIWELMGRPMREAGRPLVDRYSDAELELLIEFQRRGREMQERHAEWLRERLRAGRVPDA
jgi:DNA-binding MarR family transcriptional regulator